MFGTEITNERPFVVVKESNVSLFRITKSVHFLSESSLLMRWRSVPYQAKILMPMTHLEH